MSGLRYKGVKLLGKANGRIMYLRASNYPLHFPIINRREQAGYYNIIRYIIRGVNIRQSTMIGEYLHEGCRDART